jgi:hypothetical protein
MDPPCERKMLKATMLMKIKVLAKISGNKSESYRIDKKWVIVSPSPAAGKKGN